MLFYSMNRPNAANNGSCWMNICREQPFLVQRRMPFGVQSRRSSFLLTSKKIYSFDPATQATNERTEFQLRDNRLFKCLTYSPAQATLWIAHDQWESNCLDQWRLNEENHCWQLVHRQAIDLTSNEFLGNITALIEGSENQIGMSIFNCLTEEWRMGSSSGGDMDLSESDSPSRFKSKP